MAYCRECGEWFVPEAAWDVYCSPECGRKEWLREVKACIRTRTAAAPEDEREAPNTTPQEKTFHFTCQACGKEFTAKQATAKYCSKKCRNKAYWQQCKKAYSHTCVSCGKEFTSSMPNAKCCSDECRRKHKSVREARLAGKASQQDEGLPVCPICGNKFKPKFDQARYCSDECRKQARRAYQVQRQAQIRNDLIPPPTRKCHDCGKPTSNYRCAECQAKWRAKYAVTGAGDVEEAYSVC